MSISPDIQAKLQIIRSKRRTLSLEITQDLRIIARAPKLMPRAAVLLFVGSRQDWIIQHISLMEKKLDAARSRQQQIPDLGPAAVDALKRQARLTIPQRVSALAPVVGVKYDKVTIRSQVSRWGSCSSKGSLSFNCLMLLAPPEVLDYVVVHELCHIKVPDHSSRFWAEVQRVMPDYREKQKWLRDNGTLLIQQIRNNRQEDQ